LIGYRNFIEGDGTCNVISFIDNFARECNMIIYCTKIAFC